MKKLGPVNDLRDGDLRVFDVDDESWIVARVGDTLHAVANECGHLPQRMDLAELHGSCLRCPHHNCGFDLLTGEVLFDMGYLGLEPLRTHRVIEWDGAAWLASNE